MHRTSIATIALLASTPLAAQEQREMDAHVHGVSTLELAIEGGEVAIDLHAPGMDIVGFEYEASSPEDKDAVAAAIQQLSRPDEVIRLDEAAGCRLTEILAHLHDGDGDHMDTDAHAAGEDHDHEDHAEGEDQEHAEEDHAESEDHDHEDGSEHSEFHARYTYLCDAPDELTSIAFPFFERFENAQEIEAQFVTDSGAGSAEVGRDGAELTLE